MTPRWKIRRQDVSTGPRPIFKWVLYLDGQRETAFYVWENAITHVDNWFYDQTLRGA